MVIIYGYGTRFKREGSVAISVCTNCGHDAAQTLCKQSFRITLFGIPIVNIQSSVELCARAAEISFRLAAWSIGTVRGRRRRNRTSN